MYVVTNRRLYEDRTGLDVFGSKPAERVVNEKGPNELRIVEVARKGRGWSATAMADVLDAAEVQRLDREYDLGLDLSQTYYVSLLVACRLFDQAQREGKHLLLYVHGYNNDVGNLLDTARALEQRYGVIVMPFTWPANGGGAVSGTAAYLSDKRDARASTDALNRVIGKIGEFHEMLTRSQRRKLEKKALAAHPENPEARNARLVELLAGQCKVTLNLLCHSMGNYVLKHALLTSASEARRLVFNNICLAAADTNNAQHADWVERLQVRHRVYIVINENDFALAWARRKPGEEQLARLGHYLRDLNARNAYYLNVTEAANVGQSHAYFVGDPVENNPKLRRVFLDIFRGQTVESRLVYHPDRNFYELR